jgi:hypothetical protein
MTGSFAILFRSFWSITALEQRPCLVAADNIFYTRSHYDLRTRDARRTDAVHDDLYVFHSFAYDLQRIDERRQNDDCRAVLIVMKNGNIKLFL